MLNNLKSQAIRDDGSLEKRKEKARFCLAKEDSSVNSSSFLGTGISIKGGKKSPSSFSEVDGGRPFIYLAR